MQVENSRSKSLQSTRFVRLLDEGWTLTHAEGIAPDAVSGKTIPAAVPGSNHVDLLSAGLIPDPYLGANERSLEWLWRTGWLYRLEFKAEPPEDGEVVELVFEGLDTVANVELNGVELARTRNMHRSYRFDVGGVIASGHNELCVTFSSALEHAEQMQEQVGFRPSPYPHPYHAIRKMACSFGWDWGPDLQTAGIWKAVKLERFRQARFDSVRPLVKTCLGDSRGRHAKGSGVVDVHVALARAVDEPLVLRAQVAGAMVQVEVPSGSREALVVLEVPEIELWWPRGYGEAKLYDLELELYGEAGLLDRAERRIGFRSLKVEMASEGGGAPFMLSVNGQAIFVKGANWIPDDHLLTRVTKPRLRRRITQALDAHMNLLRVWGGGIYETEDFYDLCDEMGVLVWQDFPFACAAYSESEFLLEEVEAEARENVTRLTSHASLALYNGSNENLWGFRDWGWPEVIGGDGSWGLKYYEELLPRIVAELDPNRVYIPSSPFSPHHSHTEVHPNDPAWGLAHEWDVWNRVDYRHYRDVVPRFCAEFGFQGPATWATLQRSLPPDAFDQEHATWLQHQKADNGNEKLNRGYAPHLPSCDDFETWHWTTSLNQARAIQFAIEHYRSWWPMCAGAIVWQLNDCWPVTSWAAIDGDERKKPLWYALKHAYAPRLLTFQPRGKRGELAPNGEAHLVAVNDTSLVWEGRLHFRRLSLNGEELAASSVDLSLESRAACTFEVPADLRAVQTRADEILVAEVGNWGEEDHVRAIWTFTEDKDMAYEKSPFEATAKRVAGGYEVAIRAHGVLRDLTVLADKVAVDAEVEEALVLLLPGENFVFHIRSASVVEPADFLKRGVLVSVNALGN